jgi:membrane protease YdiL (CAAX protease family)
MTYSKKECIFKMTRVFLASFILMGVFLLPYFAYIAIVVSNALIFYAAHVGTGVWRLDTLMMAVVLCLMYMRTRDVRYCVITHVTCNILGIFSAYYLA